MYKLNKILTLRMLKYSIPLIPNAFMWWLINASNRYFILYYESIEVNGLYAVANKVPTLLTVFISIFGQAWQMSAIEEYDSDDKSKFYSDTFLYYQTFLFLGTSAILVLLKIIMSNVVADDYYLAWKFAPFLLLGVVFSSFSSFFGTNYTVAKETKGLFNTSLIGGLIIIVMNYILVPNIGALGASISTSIGFLFMWILRMRGTKCYITVTINYKKIIISVCIILLQIVVLFLNIKPLFELSLQLFLFIIMIFLNKKLLVKLLKLIMCFKYISVKKAT